MLAFKDKEEDNDALYAFQIADVTVDVRSCFFCYIGFNTLQAVKKRCNELGFPVLEEYDF